MLRDNIPRMDYPDITLERQKYYLSNIESIREIFEKKYMNWNVFDGTESKWLLKSVGAELAVANLERRKDYLDRKTSGY